MLSVQCFKQCLWKRFAIKTIQFHLHARSNSDISRYKIHKYICFNLEHRKLNSFYRRIKIHQCVIKSKDIGMIFIHSTRVNTKSKKTSQNK